MNNQRTPVASKALLAAAMGMALTLGAATSFAERPQSTSGSALTSHQNIAAFQDRINFSALSAPNPYNQFIVYYKQNSQEQNRQQALLGHLDEVNRTTGLGLDYVRTIATGGHLVKVNSRVSKSQSRELMMAFAQNDAVEFIEPDSMMTAQFTPNDSSYNQQWHYFEATGGLNLPNAWDDVDGSGVVVSVIDTGIVDHFDLDANIIGGYDFISDASAARDGNGRDSDPADEGDWFSAGECGQSFSNSSSWHGSHVAGTVAAVTNNNSGVAGVAFGAKIIVARTLGKCGGTLSDIADAIIWSSGGSVSGVPSNSNPADVINMSLGGGGSCAGTYQNAINTAVNNGTVVVVAAGNSNANVSGFRPASCNNVIAVAANDRQGNRASYSNFGALIDITAPGGETATTSNGVLSTRNGGSTTPTGGDVLTFFQGTSMASPHVAGLAALMLDADSTLTPAQIESTIKANARPVPGSCSGGCGAGIADAAATIDDILGGTPPPPPPPAGNCPAGSLDFNTFATEAYSNQDGSGSVTVADGGDTLVLTGNRWRRSTSSFNVTANTVVEFEYASGSQGEIHGIGFDENNTLSSNRIFRFWGTQSWGINYNPKYNGSGNFQTFSIPIGQTYTGGSMRLVFTNDKDSGTANNEGRYRCVRVFESGGGGSDPSFFENTTNFTINSLTTVESPIAVSRSGNAPSDLQVGVNIIHTYRGDLVIDLVAPDGTAYRLKNSNGSDGADNVITTYTVNASSEVASGTWKLRVEDVFSGDTGFIDSWSLQF